jgi:carboxypeptidase family protein
MKIVATIAVVICFLTVCQAGQETVEYAKVRNAANLSGVVSDRSGAAIAQVRVFEMSDDWSAELRSTTTDSQGRWSFSPTVNGATYRIQFIKDGFNTVRIRVKVTKRRAKPLAVEMPVAT